MNHRNLPGLTQESTLKSELTAVAFLTLELGLVTTVHTVISLLTVDGWIFPRAAGE